MIICWYVYIFTNHIFREFIVSFDYWIYMGFCSFHNSTVLGTHTFFASQKIYLFSKSKIFKLVLLKLATANNL